MDEDAVDAGRGEIEADLGGGKAETAGEGDGGGRGIGGGRRGEEDGEEVHEGAVVEGEERE